MILSNNLSCKTHYEIIGAKEDASLEEIRKSYRSAILNFHPDKLQKPSETSNPESVMGNQFLEVQKAWEVLGDPRSRALYDNELRTLRQDVITAEDISLEDMAIEDVGGCLELSYRCRCGDFFSIDSSELAEMGHPFSRDGNGISLQAPSSLPASIILPCGSCSLKIRLVIDADFKLPSEPNS
ncbi:DPH4 homolog [Sesamum indicum]|uniref:DPH4 homolog n=1 Tax=Sesamum indicum TaxID=4182 RepID=A0A6I9TKY9_SESIN|nr:DPH4 homolog [Sesamum indicum]